VFFVPNTNVKGAIDAAVARGGPERKRVLVIWGDNASRWALRLEQQMKIIDTAAMIRNDYELVVADIADTNMGPLNLAIAQAYAAKPEPGRNAMPFLTVIETQGERAGSAIVNTSSDVWLKAGATRTNSDYFALRVQDFLAANRGAQPNATEVRTKAQANAKARDVKALVYFNDIEDHWCLRFAAWMKRPEVAEILGKHFAVAKIDMGRMPDAGVEFASLGGEKSEVAPWYVVVDGDGVRVAPDKERGEKDLGFPTGEEIGKFVKMLRRVDGTITDAEAEVIAGTLAAQGAKEAVPASAGAGVGNNPVK